jgi:hypothetical protein
LGGYPVKIDFWPNSIRIGALRAAKAARNAIAVVIAVLGAEAIQSPVLVPHMVPVVVGMRTIGNHA